MKKTAKALIFNDRSQVLIMKTRSKGEWDIPGGNLKGDETIEDCLSREIFEETGLSVKKSRLLHATKFEGKLRHFFAVTTTGKIRPALSKEHVEYKWLSPHKIPKNSKPKVKKLLKEFTRAKQRSKRKAFGKPDKPIIPINFKIAA